MTRSYRARLSLSLLPLVTAFGVYLRSRENILLSSRLFTVRQRLYRRSSPVKSRIRGRVLNRTRTGFVLLKVSFPETFATVLASRVLATRSSLLATRSSLFAPRSSLLVPRSSLLALHLFTQPDSDAPLVSFSLRMRPLLFPIFFRSFFPLTNCSRRITRITNINSFDAVLEP